ncbi:hypothetical protein ACFX16_010885 [Malus domestica]
MEGERKLSAEAVAIFREGIGLVLSRWSALQLAVDNEWGGRGSRQKAEQLAADAFSWFTQSAGIQINSLTSTMEILYIDDLEDILNEAMISLNTMTEDGSIEEVAEKLMFMYEDCLTDNFNSVESLRDANHRRGAVPHVRQENEDDDDDDDDDNEETDGSSNMMVDIPESQPNLDPADATSSKPTPKPAAKTEDGWEVVGPRRNRGQWHLLHSSVGISAMHMQLLRTNKVIMFDRTDYGPSNISLPRGQCRRDPNDTVLKVDCTAHSILYDLGSNTFRPLTVHTDTWCSSGSILPDGTLVQTGGYNDGDRVVRTFSPCNNDNCDWLELPNYLIQRRWYATNQILPDGRVIIVGGRRQFNYEFYPRSSQNQGGPHTIWLEFLRQTTDQDENNLYPFLHLLPDGNLFIFANAKSIIFDYSQNAVVRELPDIPGGDPRNYPSTGSSVLLPLDENTPSNGNMEVEIMVCGGTPRNSHVLALHGEFISALGTCGRLNVYDPNPRWVVEFMPVPRVMADMLLLPTGDVVIINGAALGAAGWENGRDPVTTPVIYRPSEVLNRRFSVMTGSSRARLYHSAAVLVPDGRILVGGSNPHIYYNFTGVEYPTDLSLEAFSPPYLSDEYDPVRPRIAAIEDVFGYRQLISVEILVPEFLSVRVLSARLVAPSFTTHSFAMNQRMVVLKLIGVTHVAAGTYRVSLVGPSTAEIAPPGYYLLFVVHADIPSSAAWVRVQ